MSALIEIDRIDGMLRGIDGPGADADLLGPDEWRAGTDAGLVLAVDAEPEARFAAARLIAVEFPVFHDGRGLSLAVLLRTRIGFTGELRAIGDVHPELIHYLRRCGFDSFLLPQAHSLAPDDDRLAPYSDYYQASMAETLPAFRRDRRGV
jgi:uncharacterized protein (DUF934 family)